ncbi:MAG TPA: phosphate acyltransferase, partial [Spirochaetota bacterium]|nr:phosphate acyltransferase [Spirochaetota bacterium]
MLTHFKDRVRSNPGRIIFPEGEDPRVAGAVKRLADEGLIREAVLLGNPDTIRGNARRVSLENGFYRTMDIDTLVKDARYGNEYRKARNLSVLEGEILDDAMRDP